MFLIITPSHKKGYYSFSRLLREEKIVAICEKLEIQVPTKKDLPVKIAFNQISIEELEIDTRV